MRGTFNKLVVLILCFLLNIASAAVPKSLTNALQDEPSLLKNLLAVGSIHANWTFSGIVLNENDERYQFYLEIQRENQNLIAVAALVNGLNKEVILYEESSGEIDQSDGTSLHVGRIFLRFNPINDSWIFGVKEKNGVGFNFKVDMLGLSDNNNIKQHKLHSGTELLITQTGHLNGHLQIGLGNKEQFVTAQRTWFRQVWTNMQQSIMQPVQGVLCQFNDGSAFFSINADETEALKSTIAGWRNSQGQTETMSSAVIVKEEKEGNWTIKVPTPKLRITLEDMLFKKNETHHLIVGYFDGSSPGFCAISQKETSKIKTT